MTEEEFLTSDDPARMLSWLILPSAGVLPEPGISARKLRLFACACCRLAGTKALTVDGYEKHGSPILLGEGRHTDLKWAKSWTEKGINKPSLLIRADLIRKMMGNPWRRVQICPACPPGDLSRCTVRQRIVTPQVLALAEAAYEERGQEGTLDPLRLAILADALEESGCAEERLLEHLRGPGRHYRGCWALDCALGRE